MHAVLKMIHVIFIQQKNKEIIFLSEHKYIIIDLRVKNFKSCFLLSIINSELPTIRNIFIFYFKR